MVLFHRCPWKMRLATRAFAASRGGWSFVKLPFGSRNSATVHKVVIQKISFPFFQNRPKHMCIIYIYISYILYIFVGDWNARSQETGQTGKLLHT